MSGPFMSPGPGWVRSDPVGRVPWAESPWILNGVVTRFFKVIFCSN